jgi:hypothetical protein
MASAYGSWDALDSVSYLERRACNERLPSAKRCDPLVSAFRVAHVHIQYF